MAAAWPPDSLYDFSIDLITQDFILNGYRKIRDKWFDYRSGFGERAAGQKIAGLEDKREQGRIRAETDEYGLRGSQARKTRWQLWEPARAEQQQQQDERQDTFESIQEETDRLIQWRRRAHEGARDEKEHQTIDEQFEAFMRELQIRLQRLRPPRL